ncbi:MAG: PfkB family carbohydrate kinase [Bifidobacteriaceae bacterium]|jgi:sugar/nucleoside kinase (ribokinase family)|nr:PfkB family carbohydrate kinase [Bifidobacteriaceae bacterium]
MTALLVALGLTTVDSIQQLDRIPGSNEKVQARAARLDVGGPAANACLAARAAGCAARLVSAIGGGALARTVLDRLVGGAVDVVDLAPPGYEPPVSTVLLTTGTQDRAVISLNTRELTRPAPLPADVLRGAGAALVDGHIMDRAVEFAARAQRQGVPVVFDGGSWKEGTRDLLRYVDVAVLSADFAPPDGLFAASRRGLACQGPAERVAARQTLAQVARMGPRWVAMSRGPGPVSVRWEGGAVEELAVTPVGTVVDTLGAGDALHGGFAGVIAALPGQRDSLDETGVRRALLAGIALARRSVEFAGALRPPNPGTDPQGVAPQGPT